MTLVHDYETDLDTRSYSRLYHDERKMAFSAMDCVLNGEKGIYASSALTTGTRAYELLDDHGVRSMRELEEPHRDALLTANMEEAGRFAARLRERLGGHELVITPAPFAAPGWTQAEYLAFWEELIRTRVKAVYFNDGWELSNGCTFEYAVAREAGVATFAADGSALPPDAAAGMMERAAAEVEARGYDASRLRINLDRIRRAR
ncbi:MAG TPA: hypothetical protein VFS20_11685 [Longimicrobium sp.]|nr:hypothetical protein [Longimicrobium sp.]